MAEPLHMAQPPSAGAAISPAVSQALFAVVLAVPLFLRLGSAPLFDVDEGAFSEATREMLASGDWWHTTLNGEARFDKPPAVYWFQALSVSVFGLNEAALRLPSALCAWLQALLLMSFASQQWGATAGRLAGLMAVSALGPLVIGRSATADAMLNVLITAAALDAWRYLAGGSMTYWRRACLWVGLGWLVKGPIALLVPGAAVLLWVCSGQSWARLKSALMDLPSWLLVAVALPWYLYAYQRHGAAFVDGFFLRHNLQRFGSTLEGHAGGPFYYLLLLPVLALPWTPLLWPVLRGWRSAWSQPLHRYLLGWAVFVLVFFSLSGTKLPHYILYGFSPLVLLMAAAANRLSSRGRYWVCLSVGCSAALLALGSWLLHREAAQWITHPLYRALLAGAPAPREMLALGMALTAACALTARWSARMPSVMPAAGLAFAIFVGAWVHPWWGEAIQGPVRRAAAAVPPGAAAVQWGVHQPSWAVYLQREAPRRAPELGEFALTRTDHLQAAQQRVGINGHSGQSGQSGNKVVWAERGFVLLHREAPP
jgi:4-amino-4-deoxy-L-arabinose transferase-like glycosyltransferase